MYKKGDLAIYNSPKEILVEILYVFDHSGVLCVKFPICNGGAMYTHTYSIDDLVRLLPGKSWGEYSKGFEGRIGKIVEISESYNLFQNRSELIIRVVYPDGRWLRLYAKTVELVFST